MVKAQQAQQLARTREPSQNQRGMKVTAQLHEMIESNFKTGNTTTAAMERIVNREQKLAQRAIRASAISSLKIKKQRQKARDREGVQEQRQESKNSPGSHANNKKD